MEGPKSLEDLIGAVPGDEVTDDFEDMDDMDWDDPVFADECAQAAMDAPSKPTCTQELAHVITVEVSDR